MPTVHSLLMQATSLVHCELTINDSSINISPYQKLTLPNLKSLHISLQCPLKWEDLLEPLILPSLKMFKLGFHTTNREYLRWPQALTSLIIWSQCDLDILSTECDYTHLLVSPNFMPLL